MCLSTISATECSAAPFSTELSLNSQSDGAASHCTSGRTVLKQEGGDYCAVALECDTASPLAHGFSKAKVKISEIQFYTKVFGCLRSENSHLRW